MDLFQPRNFTFLSRKSATLPRIAISIQEFLLLNPELFPPFPELNLPE